MSFANLVQDTVDLADGHRVVIRKLGWKVLQKAQEQKQIGAAQISRVLGADYGVQIRRAIQDAGGVEALRQAGDADPFLIHDQATLLYRGIVSWDYDRDVSEASIDELDADTAGTIARRIFELSRMKTEGERKNS